MTQHSVDYSIVDVFTRTRFAGNQVAVIHDGHALTNPQMQKIACEFGFSETTFILPPESDAHYARVRIFTPFEEIPFAGHPNIGTAFVMGSERTAARGALADLAVFDELGGDVVVRAMHEDGDIVGAEIEAPQPLQRIGDVPAETIAKCLGVEGDVVLLERFAPCVASVGLRFAFAELKDLDALAAIAPDIPSCREAASVEPSTVDGFAICAFVVLDASDARFDVRSRVLSPLGHPAEDPATGSASGALAALLAGSKERAITVSITQGVEMGRKSEIVVTVPPAPSPVRIRGYCVSVATGTLRL